METVRLRLDVAYDGTAFSGWAAQPGRRTVQADLEAALARVLRVGSVATTCAGRTDAGVHARGQVCHVDAPAGTDPADLRRRLAGVLRDDVRVRAIVVAPEGFDARFSALWRRYAYRICDDPAAMDPLARRYVLAWPRRLDVGAMNQTSARLLGEHDFAAYCRQRAGATTVRTLREFTWSRAGNGLLDARVLADAFCHSMVRSLVGAAIATGEGRVPIDFPRQVLDAGVRNPRLSVVAPHGLTLEEVAYPADSMLAARAEQARSRRDLGSPTP